ncbi:hypothetical protein C3L33_10904, partial [Rhododendron williamsianum]
MKGRVTKAVKKRYKMKGRIMKAVLRLLDGLRLSNLDIVKKVKDDMKKAKEDRLRLGKELQKDQSGEAKEVKIRLGTDIQDDQSEEAEDKLRLGKDVQDEEEPERTIRGLPSDPVAAVDGPSTFHSRRRPVHPSKSKLKPTVLISPPPPMHDDQANSPPPPLPHDLITDRIERKYECCSDNCSSLEELSVKRLHGLTDGEPAAEPVRPGVTATSLKTICLKELYNGQCFGPLIIGSKNLRTLKIFRCSGDWDTLLELITSRVTGMVEIHLERLQVSDTGVTAISNCMYLEILNLVKTPECTNLGLKAVAENCKLLQLVLIGINPTRLSLELIAANCQNLERLALCGSETVGDVEISCIAAKCITLKKLCIKSCPVSNHGMEALARGCPNLVKVKVKKCRGVTCEGADWLRTSRGSLAVNLDTGENDHQDASASDSNAQKMVWKCHPHQWLHKVVVVGLTLH